MRVDKFLWAVRVFKTRQLAAEACKSNRVEVEGKTVKAAKVLEGNETLHIRKAQKEIILKIKTFPPSRVGAQKLEDYIQDLTPKPNQTSGDTQAAGHGPLPKKKKYKEKEKKISKRERQKAIEARTGMSTL